MLRCLVNGIDVCATAPVVRLDQVSGAAESGAKLNTARTSSRHYKLVRWVGDSNPDVPAIIRSQNVNPSSSGAALKRERARCS